MKIWLLTALLWLVSAAAVAQRGMSDDRRKDFEAQKVAFMAKVMDLTPTEAAAFWPLYHDMQKRIRTLGKKVSARDVELGRQGKATEADYALALQEMLEVQRRIIEVKASAYAEMGRVLPASKLWRLNKAERRFHRFLLNRLKKDRNRQD